MSLLVFKALHIIFVVTWFAGLFYIVRLFIYHSEAKEKPEPEKSILSNQFKLMESRLWYFITWPSAIITAVLGFSLLYIQNYWLMPFMHVKLTLLVGLYAYHIWCGVIFNQLQKDEFKYSSFQLRLINEIATLFLFAIVFVIVLKDKFNWKWGVGSLLVLVTILALAIRSYKKRRDSSKN